MVFQGTFTRDHESLVEMVRKLFANRAHKIQRIDLFGQASIDCRCWVDILTPQGDEARIELSHADLVAVVRDNLQTQGYRDFQVKLTALNEDHNGVFRGVVCNVSLDFTVCQKLPS